MTIMDINKTPRDPDLGIEKQNSSANTENIR